MLNWDVMQDRARRFAKNHERRYSEEAESQPFLMDFFRVFGVEDFLEHGRFEHKVWEHDGHCGKMDAFWPGELAIEMKSRGKLKESYKQLQDYVFRLPKAEMPDLLMRCDFEWIHIEYRETGKTVGFKTKDLHKHVRIFYRLAGHPETYAPEPQFEVTVKAADKMADLHDTLIKHGYNGHELEVYLVRLLFMLFADDTGIFQRDAFLDVVRNSREDGSDLANHIAEIFDVLNLEPAVRDARTVISDAVKMNFKYVNGGLFSEQLKLLKFNAETRELLLDCCRFDWNKISPAIFGSMFQGVMNKEKRRDLGAHYTSEENILKLINPLFMDALREEFEHIKYDKAKLEKFHDKIASLKFLDPACGCGNFLIISYRELRRLELDILTWSLDSSSEELFLKERIRVNVDQFYGIEIEDFPVQIATVGMWLMDHLMNNLCASHFSEAFDRLPLTKSAKIKHANALTTDWESVLPKNELSYIIGNPPFSGARIMSAEQKTNLMSVFNNLSGAGELDFVTCWYKLAAQYIAGTDIRVGFVSTNSICQGEQTAILWQHLFEIYDMQIDFAYRTFKWRNDAKGKAAIHCIIVGFGKHSPLIEKWIFDNGAKTKALNINPYLVDAPDVYVTAKNYSLCDVPKIGSGNKPIDGGHYLFTDEEKNAFIALEPQSERYFRKWLGSDEFINGWCRWCLWLGDASPSELRNMPHALKRVEAVRSLRLASRSAGTRKIAEKPTRFHVENMPKADYLLVPLTSSERREYIPIGFLDSLTISSNANLIIPSATLYHFGVITSRVHMAWMRAICCRLKSDYRYSATIVYNNFPWPTTTPEQQSHIAQLAQTVLDARAAYPDSSLAALYDPRTAGNTPLLQKAHADLDRAVCRLYGYKSNITEPEIVADLMRRYQELTALPL